ncbi:TRAP transporter substrate-binding protein DctP [Marinivivus vitaminiproducens]|uniref:TRAP transporter substrate-binding protein DctP n=1 Tax=Marinivivus vitaminiproducens TaxID=3035935 RepID=UPI0027A4C8B9|nr:TRAP transporter substrate-binding protein DctP [Geminicoccaceae bacterium SCSIO 64248]
MNRLTGLGALGLAALALTMDATAPRPAMAADTEWRAHLVWVPTRQETKYFETWANRVNERTGDAFEISVHPGGSLGVKDTDMLRILPMGNVIQATMLYAGYVSRDAPELATVLPEGVLATADDAVKALPVLNEIFDASYSSRGVKTLATFMAPDRTINIYCSQPVNTLEQLRERKLRVWSKTMVDTFAKIGVSATIVPQNDMYMAMQTGVVDCATYYPAAANTLSLHEIAPYWSYLSPYAVPLEVIVSQRAWDDLPEDIQAILMEEAQAVAKETADAFLSGEFEKSEGIRYDELGGEMIEPFPEADQKAFTEAALQTWEADATALGEPASGNYERLHSLLYE